MREPLELAMVDRLDHLLDHRSGGEPLAYITGSVVFHGIEMDCGTGVLVPRPETEVLVDVALELIREHRDPIVVDIGTGTGAVAVAVAATRRDARIWATDVSSVALRYAARNIERIGANVTLLRGDLFAALPGELRGRVDLVVSNPPYVPAGAELPADVRAEPSRAVRAGARGDEVLRRLVDESPPWLSAHGAIALEIGTAEQSQVLLAELTACASSGVRNDSNGRPRVVWARR
jgi:release factor glutamine methyltransferase